MPREAMQVVPVKDPAKSREVAADMSKDISVKVLIICAHPALKGSVGAMGWAHGDENALPTHTKLFSEVSLMLRATLTAMKEQSKVASVMSDVRKMFSGLRNPLKFLVITSDDSGILIEEFYRDSPEKPH